MLAYICDRCKKLLSNYTPESNNEKFKIKKSIGLGAWQNVSLCADCETAFMNWLDNSASNKRAATISEQVEAKGYYVPSDKIDIELEPESE